VRIAWVRRGETGFAATDLEPVGIGDTAAGQTIAGSAGGAEVLHGPGDPVRYAAVHRDMVKLSQRQRRREPAVAAVNGDIDPAVDVRPGVAAVDAAEQSAGVRLDHSVHALSVRWCHRNADLSPNTFGQALAWSSRRCVFFWGELFPGIAAVARDVETAARSAT